MKKQRGFTLIELLIVIAIIGLLASIVMAALLTARVQSSGIAAAQNAQQISKAVEMYYQDNGAYPLSGGVATSSNSSWTTLGNILSPYLSRLPSGIGTYQNNAISTYTEYEYVGPSNTLYLLVDPNQPNNVYCFIPATGYAIIVAGVSPSLEANDGGMVSDVYEIYGGSSYHGTYHSGFSNPAQTCH